jgi:hypothetical protein
MFYSVVILSFLLRACAQTISTPLAHELVRRQTAANFIGYTKAGNSCRFLDKRSCRHN